MGSKSAAPMRSGAPRIPFPGRDPLDYPNRADIQHWRNILNIRIVLRVGVAAHAPGLKERWVRMSD
jgi:hypothetical protein